MTMKLEMHLWRLSSNQFRVVCGVVVAWVIAGGGGCFGQDSTKLAESSASSTSPVDPTIQELMEQAGKLVDAFNRSDVAAIEATFCRTAS